MKHHVIASQEENASEKDQTRFMFNTLGMWLLSRRVVPALRTSSGFTWDVAPGGHYFLNLIAAGNKAGIYGYSVAEKKCTPLVPGVVTFSILFSRDGKSILYAIPSRRDVTIYRQNWQAGKSIGQPQVALRLPFAFPLVSGGNAYDITRDLSTVVYARPGGHADLYLLSQK